ncbi:nucleotidyltransferase family protein [Stappia indica]|uniref:nucleotidyltransferase family protein n=1 Tax=Stappia indica TaxID=538381 RepID=UPI00083101EE|nr:nucleotidyltransferase family protein [Stappia indica]
MKPAQAVPPALGQGLAFGRTTLGDPSLTGEDDRRRVLELILRTDPVVMRVLRIARSLALPDWRLASGAIYQTVWNALTGRPAGHGIRDFDLLYFDGADTSYEAEDRVITRARPSFSRLPAPVEIRNQARVALWFRQKHGIDYPTLSCTDEALVNYAARTHSVAVRLEADGRLSLAAPFGLADIFAMRLVPNPVLDNASTYLDKALRMKAAWPELEILPWPSDRAATAATAKTGQGPASASPAELPAVPANEDEPDEETPAGGSVPLSHREELLRQSPFRRHLAGDRYARLVRGDFGASADPVEEGEGEDKKTDAAQASRPAGASASDQPAASVARDWIRVSTSPRSEFPR